MQQTSRVRTIAVTLAVAVGLVAVLVVARSKLGHGMRSNAQASDVVHVGLAGLGEINTLDPARAGTAAPITIVWHMYDRLVDVRPDGKIAPMLAASWESNPEMKEWRFRLRSDARFHRGSEGEPGRLISATDVRASLKRALRIPGFAQTLLGDVVVGAREYISGESDRLEGLEASDGQVVLRLSKPFAFLPERLAASFLSIVPAETPLEPTEVPIGSGPYNLVLWDRVSEQVTLERNDHYWAAFSPASPKRLVFHRFENEGTAVEEIIAGAIDWMEATSTSLQLVRSTGRKKKLRVDTPPHTDIRLIAINMSRNPFADNPRIGAALNYATDRKAFVDALGGGEPLGSAVPTSLMRETGHQFEYNPDRARGLLNGQAPSAFRLEMLVQPGQEARMIAELVRQQWAKVGIDLTLKQGLADFFEHVVQGNYQLALAYYGPFVPSAEQYLWPYRAQAQPVPNVMKYSQPAFERSYDLFTSTTDRGRSAAALNDSLRILFEQAPAVWLLRAPRVVVSRADLAAPRAGSIPLFNHLEVVQ